MVQTYQDYLKTKHSKFNTSESLINNVVSKACNSLPISRQKLLFGEVNEVYEVETQNGQKIIVRISRSKHSSFEAERIAIDLVRKVGVPAPEVLLIEKANDGDQQLTLCIERKIDGEALSHKVKYYKDKPDEYQRILIEHGDILSNIHSVIVPNFDGLDREKGSEFHSWSEFIFRTENKKDRIHKAASIIGVDSKLVDRAFTILRNHNSLYTDVKPQLLHGDCGLKHILVKNDHIVGIIDFENCMGGDPVYDFAWLDYFYRDTLPLDAVKRGYKDKLILQNDFDTRLALYRIHLGLTMIDYYESEKNESGIEDSKKSFITDVSEFKTN